MLRSWIVVVVALLGLPISQVIGGGSSDALGSVPGLGEIRGRVWNDLNGNGKADVNEPGLQGHEVCLNTGQNAFSDPNGQFAFSGLKPGDYEVSARPTQGWFQSFPALPNNTLPQYAWSNTAKARADGACEYAVVKTEPNGSILCAGHFQGTIDLDPSGGSDVRTSRGGRDVLVTRYDPKGLRLWTQIFGGVGDDTVGDMVVDAHGAIYLIGTFGFEIDFGCGNGSDVHKAVGLYDVFVTKLMPDGSCAWTRTFGGLNAQAVGSGIGLDRGGNLYLTGCFSGTVDFDPGASQDIRASWILATWMFLTQLKPDGSYGWTRSVGSNNWTFGKRVLADEADGVYVAGNFRGEVDFDPGMAVDMHIYSGDPDIFLTKYRTDGTYLWTRRIGGACPEQPYDMTLDPDGNICMTGAYSSLVDFDPGQGTDFRETTHVEVGECFATKLGPDGDYLWTTTYGNDLVRTAGTGIVSDPERCFYVIGERTDADCIGSSEVFLLKLDPSGKILWTQAWGMLVETKTTGDTFGPFARFDPYTWDVALASTGDLFAVGRFSGVADLDPGQSGALAWCNGVTDAFLSRLDRPLGSYHVTVIAGQAIDNIDFGDMSSQTQVFWP